MSEPKFIPRPGQIDLTNVRRAPVINCVVKYKDKILIVQRSVEQKAKDEIKEELGKEEKDIITIHEGDVFEQEEPNYGKTWIVHPVLVDVNTDKITLDWEAERYKWIDVVDAAKFNLLPGFDRVLEVLFSSK